MSAPTKEENRPRSKSCPTRLISDKPAEKDLFALKNALGPHEKVAHALAELIRSEDSGGKMVGLEGGWGSGKTTIINFVSQLLTDTAEITLFRFDAWAHQNDPLRRTYLESLILHIQGKHWLQSNDSRERWKTRLLELSRRHKETETHKETLPTTFGKLVAIATILVPIGLILLKKGLDDGLTLARTGFVNWYFLIGALLSTAPFWLGIYYRVRRGEKFDFALTEAKGRETVKTRTIETPEPTSLEFENYFNELMRDALQSHENRAMVIVLDNLDRVSATDFQVIWAALQTFLQHRGTKDEHWHRQIRFVVPYDPDGLRILWATPTTRGPDGALANGPVSDSFLNKSFQIRFQVPPLLLSNWKAYLTNLLHEAMPEHPEDECQRIYHVFSRCRQGPAPTPRELILYVNQVGAVHRQWCGHFPLDHIAYYAYLRRETSSDGIYSALLQAAYPGKGLEELFPSVVDLRCNLAGLFFNVPAERGMELVLGDPLFAALIQNDFQALRTMAQRHGDAFWNVLEQVALSRFVGVDANDLSNAGSCLNESGIFNREDRNRAEAKIVRRNLANGARKITNWLPVKQSLLNGIAAICRIAEDPNTSASVFTVLRNNLDGSSPLAADAAMPIVYSVVAMLETASDLGHEAALNGSFKMPVDGKTWIQLCPQLAAKALSPWHTHIQPKVGFEGVAEALALHAEEGTWNDDCTAAVRITHECFPEDNWLAVVNAIDARLQVKPPKSPLEAEVDALLQALKIIRRYNTPEVLDVFKRLAEDGWLLHWLHAAQTASTRYKADCVAAFMEKRPDLSAPPSFGSTDVRFGTFLSLLGVEDEDLAKELVDILGSAGNLNLLFKVIDARETYDPLIVSCLRVVAVSEYSESLFTPEALLARWKNLREHLSTFENMVGLLSKQPGFVTHPSDCETSLRLNTHPAISR